MARVHNWQPVVASCRYEFSRGLYVVRTHYRCLCCGNMRLDREFIEDEAIAESRADEIMQYIATLPEWEYFWLEQGRNLLKTSIVMVDMRHMT